VIARPSIVSSLVPLPLTGLFPRPLLWGLVFLSLCASLVQLPPPELWPRLSSRLWGPLPQYTLLVRGGDTCQRCSVDAAGEPAVRVRLDAPLDLVLRPAQPVPGPVFVYAFLAHDERTSAWPILMEHAAAGTLRLGGITRDLLDVESTARGRYELIFLVQRSPLPPGAAAGQARTARADPQLLRGEIELLPALND